MFDRSKRKSFLFFGASSQDQKQKSPGTNGDRYSANTKAITQPRPLNKNPLNSNHSLTDDAKDSLSNLRSSSDFMSHEAEQQEHMPLRQSTIGRRRPPPPVDIGSILTSAGSQRSASTAKSALEKDETTSSASAIEGRSIKSPQDFSKTPESAEVYQGTNIEEFQPSHQRQKSEVEQLVDHLDDFIHQSTFDVRSSPHSVDGDSVIPQLDTKTDVPSDNESSKNVSPLYGNLSAKLSAIELDDNHSKGEQSSDDQFSYNESLNEEIEASESQKDTAASSLSDVGGIQPSSRFIVTNANEAYESEPEEGFVDLQEYEAGCDQLTENEAADASADENHLYQMMQGSEYERRKFRVVNEEKPNFYFNDSTSEEENHSHRNTDTNSITTSLARRNSESSSAKGGLSSLPSNGDSHHSSLLESKSIDNDTINTANSKMGLKKTGTKGTIPDKNVRLISSYVEELRLLYFPTSNSLQLPPDLPYALKNKNSLEQPQNIKVTIRTSTRQVGIKHGKAKQKLLSLETTKEEEEGEESGSNSIAGLKFNSESTKVDHTKEFHTLFKKDEKISEADQDILDDIPGDEAYDSDDLMAPLRENPEQRIHYEVSQTRLKRSDTVSSYFTRNAGRMRSGTLDVSYTPQLPLDLRKYDNNDETQKTSNNISENNGTPLKASRPVIDEDDDDYEFDSSDFVYYQGSVGNGLRITNPDSD
ncbi:unnamed protein product [Kluyveromyces dobzhanskii CBS 2104]|uniref:WGS project CCBQ000000000 data, contig 00041 n=1 Tax=Kluyveromyces dobzhanskii CBS 2104 TaxID=1427455 RepID=A0A0A8L298_9SACH|nr:unnamed protein product [Kluyveromyces dobzhanskii CBS 2104]